MASTYPVRLEGRPDAELSRWLWLVKWVLVIPHMIVLMFLWTAFWVLTVFAFFAILITGRYPRSVFDFNVGVMRWSWRVAFYAYGALGTDRYPPFSLGEEPDYPATLDIEYPQRLSRGLVLVKSWLLAIPHYVIVGFFLGGAGLFGWRWDGGVLLGGSGLIALVVLIGAVILLFTGKFPREIQDFVLGMNRWVVRVGAYATLMTDKYPPFRLDSGPTEDKDSIVEHNDPPAHPAGSASRVTAVVLGALAMLVGLGLAAGGGVLVWSDQTQKDPAGYIQTGTQHFATATQVLRFDDLDLRGIPHWMLGDVRVRTRSDRPVFVGIGHSGDVARYLAGARYDQVGVMSPRMYRQGWMAEQLAPPGQQRFWYASTSGSGAQQLDWDVQTGQWTLVVLNSDTSSQVDVDMSVGATVPGLLPVGVVLLGIGAAAIAGGVLSQYFGLRRKSG